MSATTIVRRLVAVPFATVIALLGVNSAATLLIDPNRTPIHLLTAPWDYLWAAQYGLGGLLIIAGIGLAVPRLEAAGCVSFAGGALVQALVLAVVLRWPGWNSVLLLVVFCAAAVLRAVHIAHGHSVVLVDITPRLGKQ